MLMSIKFNYFLINNMKKIILTTLTSLLLMANALSANVGIGVNVANIQRHLVGLCYDPGPINGVWSEKTEQAVKKAYSNQKVNYDGHFSQKDEVFVIRLGYKARFEDKKHCYEIRSQNKDKQLTVFDKLEKRRTINSFIPWTVYSDKDNWLRKAAYKESQLFWTSQNGLQWTYPRSGKNNFPLVLVAPNWMFELKSNMTPGLSEFYHQWPLKIDEYKGQPARYPINISDKNYPTALSDVLEEQMLQNSLDGFSFDWWHDDLERFQKGKSKAQIKKIRLNIVKALREKIGPNKIIVGNTNYRDDISTHKYLNGVFMEVSSKGRAYSSSEISRIEKLMHHHNKYLQHPKIILLKTDKIYDPNQSYDWSHPKNRKAAKLFAAMTVVIPDNGYFLYEMGGKEMKKKYPNHWASITYDYKFYDFNIGKPVSEFKKIKNRAGYKEHEKGFVAYNADRFATSFVYKEEHDINLPGLSGLFCEEKETEINCLTVD